MIFIVALYTPWCRYLGSCPNISPQLYADNLKCTSYDVDSVLTAAQYTVSFVRAVGQEASPSKCVLLSTSKAARKCMTAWRNRNEGCFWAVKLDVRDLGGHLDVTLRAIAGTFNQSGQTRHYPSSCCWRPPPGVSTHAWTGEIQISAWWTAWL